MSRHRVTVVPHTHWDREWYQPFSVFQARLIEAVDQILSLLDDDPSFNHFMLDGQAVVLDDYLAIRPEAEERIRGFVENGRLAIGPWYTLADEFLASPEALVRNLQMGMAVCRRFGEPMAVVYTPDSFGHISQLPLLAHGFGFDSLVFERGVGDEGEAIGGEFVWRTADGNSSVLAVHLLTTYSSAAGIGYRDWASYQEFDADRAVAHATKALYGGSQPIGMEAWLDESLERIPGGSSAYASGSNLLLLNGSDHLPPQTDLPKVIDLLNQRFADADFRLGRLRDFIDGVIAEAGELREFQGEFRGSRYHHVLSGVFSARLYLKQANHRAQQALERYAEPLSALAYQAGAPYPGAVLESAWRDLLRNHCHDSICGCSIDEVHDEMMPRFAGIVAGSAYLGRKALTHLSGGQWAVAPAPQLAGRLSPPQLNGAIAEQPGCLTTFNPTPRRWQGVLEALLPLPPGHRPQVLLDPAGNAVAAEIELLEAEAPGDVRYREPRARVRWLADLAPLSVTSFRLAGAAEGDAGSSATPPGRSITGVDTGTHLLENEHLRLAATPSGLLLTHKQSGQIVRARLSLEDVGDAGDEYDFSPVREDRKLTLALEPSTAVAGQRNPTALAASLRTTGAMRMPLELSDDRQRRVGETTLPFELSLGLAAGDPFVRLDLQLHNRAKDHRLRLRVETDVSSETLAVEGHFDVLERPLASPEAEHWFQKPSGNNHQRHFLALGDGTRGLAVFNAGLPEYAGELTPQGASVAVTLLRSVGWLSRSDLSSRPQGAGPALPTPGAQCLGDHDFQLALMPFAGEWDEAGVPAAAERFSTPPLVEATVGMGDAEGTIELPQGLQLSALKKAAGTSALILRFWNPGRLPVEGKLRLARRPEALWLVDLSESLQRELTPQAEVPLSVAPKEVVSMAIRFGGEAMG